MHTAEVAALEEANAAALAQTREALTVQHEQAQASALVALQRVQQVAQNAFSDFDDASFEGDAADAASAALARMAARHAAADDAIREIVLSSQQDTLAALEEDGGDEIFAMDDFGDEGAARGTPGAAAMSPQKTEAKLSGEGAKLDLLLQRDRDDAEARFNDALARGVDAHDAEIEVLAFEQAHEKERLAAVLTKQHAIAHKAAMAKLKARKTWRARRARAAEATRQHDDDREQVGLCCAVTFRANLSHHLTRVFCFP